MKFIFPEKAAIKFGFLLILFFCYSTSLSQGTEDSLYTYKTSESLLGRKIEFVWNGGNLSDALDKIASENAIKFSYSNTWIQNVQAAPQKISDVQLMDLLNLIFKDSGFNYVLVGRIIAIVKDENNLPSKTTTRDSSLISTDSTIRKVILNHIYTPSSPGNISDFERKLLYKIYKKELKWARHQRKSESQAVSDTAIREERIPKNFYKPTSYRYFISASAGAQNNQLAYTNNSALNWKDELNWNSKIQQSFYPEILLSIRIKSFLFGSGIGLQQLRIDYTFTETIRKGPPAFPPPPVFELVRSSVSEEYTLISIPVSILYYKQWKHLWAGIGAGAKFSFVSGNEAMKTRLLEFYKYTTGTDTYSESYKHLVPSLFIEGNIGYTFANKVTLAGGVVYNYSLSPVYENSLYNLSVNSLVLKLGLYYRFNLHNRSKKKQNA